MSPLVRRVRWLAVAVAITGLLAFASFSGSTAMTDGERVQFLSERYACPVCDGQSVAESNAAVASTIRQFIAVEVNAGSTDAEIRSDLIGSYGTEVLLAPPSDGIALLVWVLPLAVLVFGGVAIADSARRGKAQARVPTANEVALVSDALATDAQGAATRPSNANS